MKEKETTALMEAKAVVVCCIAVVERLLDALEDF